VADLLRSEIARLGPGGRLPGMRELRVRYQVSINTIGMALALLEQEGRVVRCNGNGVFVTDRADGKRIGILSELDLFDPRIGPHWRSLAGELNVPVTRNVPFYEVAVQPDEGGRSFQLRGSKDRLGRTIRRKIRVLESQPLFILNGVGTTNNQR